MEKNSSYGKRAQFYDIEYSPLNDIDFLSAYVDNSVNRILEIPCACGFHLKWLAETGKEIYLIDQEPKMVDIVKQKIAYYNQNKRLHASCGLMESCHIPQSVDLIIFPQESFQFLLNDIQVIDTLMNAHKNLTHNGVVIIDIAIFDRQINFDSENTPAYWKSSRNERELYHDWIRDIDAENKLSRESLYTETASDISFTFHYKVIRNGSYIDTYNSSVTLRKFRRDLLSDLIHEAGFVINTTFGNYGQKRYQPGDPRLIFILRKRDENRAE